MRIISGELGGRQFEAPPGEGTRPLLDRVRTALFDWLGARVDDARVLDLYAGSGSQGLEALSRGASRALFVERGAPALATLKRNVVGLGLEERARIVRGDALAERNWSEPGAVAAPWTIAFCDPPFVVYEDPAERKKLLAALEVLLERHMEPGGIVALHAPDRAGEMLRLRAARSSELRAYGSSCLVYLEAGATIGDGSHG